jgi:MOB kinase activator 1
MTAGRAEYLWKDDVQYKKPTRLSAPDYIDLLLTWVNQVISDPTLFPVEDGVKFPRSFVSEVRQIYKRLFRLYAHLYCHHAEKVKGIGANAHLNTCFKHFIYFCLEFNLMDQVDLAPLDRLIVKMRENDARSHYQHPMGR